MCPRTVPVGRGHLAPSVSTRVRVESQRCTRGLLDGLLRDLFGFLRARARAEEPRPELVGRRAASDGTWPNN